MKEAARLYKMWAVMGSKESTLPGLMIILLAMYMYLGKEMK